MYKTLSSIHQFSKNQIFLLFFCCFFPVVKITANYAKFNRVLGRLEAGFQQVQLVKFSEIFTILFGNINNKKSIEERKNTLI